MWLNHKPKPLIKSLVHTMTRLIKFHFIHFISISFEVSPKVSNFWEINFIYVKNIFLFFQPFLQIQQQKLDPKNFLKKLKQFNLLGAGNEDESRTGSDDETTSIKNLEKDVQDMHKKLHKKLEGWVVIQNYFYQNFWLILNIMALHLTNFYFYFSQM